MRKYMVHAVLLNASIYITSGEWISKFIMEFNAENVKFKKLRGIVGHSRNWKQLSNCSLTVLFLNYF